MWSGMKLRPRARLGVCAIVSHISESATSLAPSNVLAAYLRQNCMECMDYIQCLWDLSGGAEN